MPAEIRVALQGFSAFERDALRSFFRLARQRPPGYVLTESMADASFIVADADRADSVAAVQAAGRGADTVFVGAHPPTDAMVQLPRPLNPLLILRELDALNGVPLHAADFPVAAEPTPAAAADAGPARALAPLDVLVVDDSEVARRFVGRLVEQLGLRPTLVATSGEALEQLARGRYAFVLLDVMLGDDSDLDGLMLCQRIKREPPAAAGPPPRPPHVVIVSAAASGADRVLGQLAGCDAYLAKPIDEALLSRTLAGLEPALFANSAGRRRSRQRSPGGQ